MDSVHIALIALGSLMAVEALWGLLSPATLKRLMSLLTDSTPETAPGMGIFYCVLALFLWALAMATLPLSHWLLLFAGATLLAFGLACFAPGMMVKVIKHLITERSISGIRAYYAMLIVIAVLLIVIGLRPVS